MTYKEAISFLYNQLPFFQKQGGKALKNNLDNITKLCQHLGNPQQQFKSIHVAGTNGKGSTSHSLASILQESGYTVGLYTSPHLSDLRERFRINGKMCKKSELVTFIVNNKSIIDDLVPSFFEVCVAFAFDLFAKKNVDVAVIEVGLGGRLDATNLISPLLSVITNIGFDHKEILGDSLEKIAFEKAGIIKPNVPVVISEYNEVTYPIFQAVAQEKHSPLYLANNFVIKVGNSSVIDLKSNFSQENYLVTPALKGIYQLKNLKGIVLAAELLKVNFSQIKKETIELGIKNVIKNTGLKGRWQVLSKRPLIICDTGHNNEAFLEINQQLISMQKKHYYFLLGFSKDKDFTKFITQLPKPNTLFFTSFDSFRSCKKEDFDELNLSFEFVENVNEGIKKIKPLIKKEELLFVGGSTYLIAEIKNLN